MEVLQQWLDGSNFPIVTAFILGLMTEISPCPLATNITAIGFIGKELENRKMVLWRAVFYLARGSTSDSLLGSFFFFCSASLDIYGLVQVWGG